MPLNDPNVSFTNDSQFGGGSSGGGSTVLDTTPQTYADYSEYDSVTLSIRRVSSNAGSFILPEMPITEANLVGDTGELKVVVNCFLTNSHGGGTTYVLEHQDVFSIDEWIEKATGKHFVNGSWVSGGTAANGFEVLFDNGDENGPDNEGWATITFKLTAAVSDGYRSSSAVHMVQVYSDFYDDGSVDAIELRPIRASFDLYVKDSSGYLVLASVAGDYLLFDTALGDSVEDTIDFSYSDDLTADVKINRATGALHFFIDEIEVYGVLRNVYESFESLPDVPQNGEVILFNDYIPPVDGESNIEVLYPCYVAGNSDKIDKCTIAKLFGNANAKNRLFVSGNPDYFNCDWHSSAFNAYLEDKKEADSNGDFTYFGDMDYCFYGQTDNAIMGYDNVATDKMIVLKSKSKVEPTNYFRTSSLIQAIDASGNAIKGIDGSALYAESFPLATGNIGAGAMNRNSIVNLNGDTLYLSSENTICGLDIAGQMGDSQRISYSRSRLIDPELKELDLSDAVLWTDNTNVYLFASEATYVANYETFNSETAQYEWFKMDVKGVRCAAEIDGAMYFGTEDGKIYRFEKGKFSDCDKVFMSEGSILASGDSIVYNAAYNDYIDETEKLTFKPTETDIENKVFRNVGVVYETVGNNIDIIVNQEHNTLQVVALDSEGNYNSERHKVLLEELAYAGDFYLNQPDGADVIGTSSESGLSEFYVPYRIVPSDEYLDEYEVYDTDGTRIDLTPLEHANLCRVLDGEYEITDLDKENCTFKIRENGRTIDLILYAEQDEGTMSFTAEIHMHKPVKSYFIAAPAVLGDISYRKTIWAWTLSAFKEANDLQVCQATNEEKLEDMRAIAFSDSVPIGLDFKDFSFNLVDFGKSAVPRKYTYFRPLSVPFMAFGFKSDNDANSILTATSIVYTIPMLGRGDK